MYARELRKWSLKYHMSYLWLSAIVTMLLLIIYCPNATTMHLPINTKTRDPALRIPAIPTDSTGYNWWLMMDRLSSSTSSSSPSNSNRQQFQFNSNIDSSSNLSSSIISNKNNNILNTNSYKNNNNNNHPLAVFSDLRNHNARARAPVNEATAAVAAATDSIHNNHIKNHNVPNANSQINFNSYASNSLTKNAYDFSSRNSRRSNKLRRHTNTQPNANYHSPVRVGSKSVPLPLPESFTTTDSQTQTQIPISHSLSPSPSQSPVVPYTLLPHHSTVQRYAITAYHVPPESSPPAVMEFDQHRRRRLLLRQQARNRTMMLAARSRRDSATSGVPLGYLRSAPIASYSNYNNNHKKHHHNRNNNNNNGNSNNNNYHHNNNNRKRPRRYCSARDPAQLAFEAPTVFEGKIISMTRDRRANFSATVEVKEVFKKQIGFRLQKYLRLKFAYRNSSAECDIYREFLRPRGLVRGDELEQGRIYVMFVRQIDSSNFTILGQPIRKTQHVIQAVKKAVSDKYAQLASIKSITASNQTVENGKELRIVCKVQGQPPPKVTWFKDHKSINRNRRLYQFIHYKRRSELIIRSFNSSDAGTYECRAKNKVNQNLEKRSLVIKAYPMPRYNTPTQLSGGKCPEDAYEFCFNGGTCMFFKEIGSYSCVCPEGFIGERCDRKEVNNMPPSTYSNEQECGDKKYLGSYYC